MFSKLYNEARTHLSLQKDAPVLRAVQTFGQILTVPILAISSIHPSVTFRQGQPEHEISFLSG
jgi:hypothetical protein